MLLEKYIREYLFERTSLEMSPAFKRASSLSAYFDVVPRLGHAAKMEVWDSLKGICDEGSSPEMLVFEKTKHNLEKLLGTIKENLPENIELPLNEQFILGTLKDELPLILGQAGGDYGKWLASSANKTKQIIKRDDVDMMAWAIHDIYHPNESSLPKIFPSPRYSLDTFEWKVGSPSDREAMLKAIQDFFNNVGFTTGVGADDVYASVWAYVVMNIDSVDDINKLDGLNNENAKRYFAHMLEKVGYFESWLKENKGKVFVNYSV